MSRRLLQRLLGSEGASPARRAFVALLPPNLAPPDTVGAEAAYRRVEAALGMPLTMTEAFAGRAVSALVAAARSGGLPPKAAPRDLTDEEDAPLCRELSRPPMIDHFTRGLRVRNEMAALYALSALAVDPIDDRSAHYLRMLAARLGLEGELTNRLR